MSSVSFNIVSLKIVFGQYVPKGALYKVPRLEHVNKRCSKDHFCGLHHFYVTRDVIFTEI